MKKLLVILAIVGVVEAGSYLNWVRQTVPYRYIIDVVDQVRFNQMWEEFKGKAKSYFDNNPQASVYKETLRLHGNIAPVEEQENYKAGSILFESFGRKESNSRMITYELKAYKFAQGMQGAQNRATEQSSVSSVSKLSLDEIIVQEVQKILASLQTRPGQQWQQAEITLPNEPDSLDKWVKFEQAGTTNSIYYKLMKTQYPEKFRLTVSIYSGLEKKIE